MLNIQDMFKDEGLKGWMNMEGWMEGWMNE